MTPQPPARRVLVADDDAGIRSLLQALLERRGVAVELVADGNAALARIGAKSYDAILLDLMMPATTGFEVVRRLQADHPQVLHCVIVVTAAAERTLRHFDGSAVRRVFHKPFDIDELMDEVFAAFAWSGGLQPADENPGGLKPAAPRVPTGSASAPSHHPAS